MDIVVRKLDGHPSYGVFLGGDLVGRAETRREAYACRQRLVDELQRFGAAWDAWVAAERRAQEAFEAL